jgi:hypothetical protein
MATDTASSDIGTQAGNQQVFTLYAAGERIYASNARQKLIDLGPLTGEDGRFGYALEGTELGGHGFPTVEAALHDVGNRLRFLWLDGQFTAQADLRGTDGIHLDGVPQEQVTLDELGPGEPFEDASV